jgi:hypothetical protein
MEWVRQLDVWMALIALTAGAWYLVVKPLLQRFGIFVVMSSETRAASPSSVVEPPQQRPAKSSVAGVAMLQDEDNEPLSDAEGAKLHALAALIIESRKKAFQNGQVPETRGLHVVFGVTASSDPKSEYQRLRLLLRDELFRRTAPPAKEYAPITPEQQATHDAIHAR